MSNLSNYQVFFVNTNNNFNLINNNNNITNQEIL